MNATNGTGAMAAMADIGINDRALCAATARLLQASGVVSAWSLALAIAGIAVLALTGSPLPMVSSLGFAAAVLLGLPECYLAFRLRLDAGLFTDLAAHRIASLAMLDDALERLGLRRQRVGEPRSLDDRIAGARQLLRRHAALVACQSIVFLLAMLARTLR